jgi:hypothetical protein
MSRPGLFTIAALGGNEKLDGMIEAVSFGIAHGILVQSAEMGAAGGLTAQTESVLLCCPRIGSFFVYICNPFRISGLMNETSIRQSLGTRLAVQIIRSLLNQIAMG